jgi:prepilin-type N-terminal cleavage/methylation domain-containing protein
MSFNYRDKKTETPAMRTRESGFSMVELMIVCVIMVIIAGIAVPNIFRTYRNYQLDAAGHSVASLLQQARMQAVKTNLPAYAIATNNSSFTYVASTPTGAYVNGSPDVAMSNAVTFQPPDTSAGFHTQLDTYLQGTPLIAGSIGFNARGLPCTTAGNPTVCTPPVGTNGFIWFMQSAGGWEAVTVTAAGRIKSWRLNSQSNGVTTWQ